MPQNRKSGILRKITNRSQVFHSTGEFPSGYILEDLECGHSVRTAIDSPYPFASRNRRRCAECKKEQTANSH